MLEIDVTMQCLEIHAARPHELLKLRIKDVVFKLTPDKKQYAEILVNGKTGTRHIPLIRLNTIHKRLDFAASSRR